MSALTVGVLLETATGERLATRDEILAGSCVIAVVRPPGAALVAALRIPRGEVPRAATS